MQCSVFMPAHDNSHADNIDDGVDDDVGEGVGNGLVATSMSKLVHDS